MASRVTQVSRRVLGPFDGNARVTQLSQRVLGPFDGNARVTQLSRRVLVTNYATPGQSVRVTIVD